MIRLFILLFLLSINMMALAQKDSLVPTKDVPLKNTTAEPIKLTNTQQKWLNSNYKKIAGLKKDSATAVVRKKFTSIPEASLEYMISSAAKMLHGDTQQEITVLKQILDQLKQQKQGLLNKIEEKQNQLDKETDPAKRKAITNEILALKKKLKETEDNIRSKEEAIRQIEPSS